MLSVELEGQFTRAASGLIANLTVQRFVPQKEFMRPRCRMSARGYPNIRCLSIGL